MKTTLNLPDDVAREPSRRAAEHHLPVEEVLTSLLRQILGLAPPQHDLSAGHVLVETGDNGLPFVRGRTGAPVSTESIDALLALEQALLTAEDIQRAGGTL